MQNCWLRLKKIKKKDFFCSLLGYGSDFQWGLNSLKIKTEDWQGHWDGNVTSRLKEYTIKKKKANWNGTSKLITSQGDFLQ